MNVLKQTKGGWCASPGIFLYTKIINPTHWGIGPVSLCSVPHTIMTAVTSEVHWWNPTKN